MTIWAPGMRCVLVDRRNRKSTRAVSKEALASLGIRPIMPTTGVVYTVRTVNEWPDCTLLTLIEIDNSFCQREMGLRYEPGFNAANFRPLSETRLDQFREHLNRIPAGKVSA